jgi:DNA-binding response OmpR family regulator
MTSHRILVVEDDEGIRESLLEILADVGYEAVGAIDGGDALVKLDVLEPHPCVIILDLMMPHVDGRAFRQEQLRRPDISKIPVIVISAYRDVTYSMKELHADDFLKKPLDLKSLLNLVGRHCPAPNAPAASDSPS